MIHGPSNVTASFLIKLHSSTSKKNEVLIFTAARASKLAVTSAFKHPCVAGEEKRNKLSSSPNQYYGQIRRSQRSGSMSSMRKQGYLLTYSMEQSPS